MTPTHHLLTLWNPSYAADAMDEHLSVLLAWAGRWRRGEAPEHLPQEAPGELEHMPHYYRSQFADFWFRLWDIRRLVADATPAVIEKPGSSTGPLTRPIPALSATPPGWAVSLGVPLGAWT